MTALRGTQQRLWDPACLAWVEPRFGAQSGRASGQCSKHLSVVSCWLGVVTSTAWRAWPTGQAEPDNWQVLTDNSVATSYNPVACRLICLTWSSIPMARTRETPGQAVGRSF